MLNLIRELASSFDNQILYARMKDGVPVQFFENKKDFTSLQISFLYWLEIYHGLYSSLSTDNPYLNDAVISDEVRCDSYLKHRGKLLKELADRDKPINSNRNPRKRKKGIPVPGIPTVCYRPRGE